MSPITIVDIPSIILAAVLVYVVIMLMSMLARSLDLKGEVSPTTPCPRVGNAIVGETQIRDHQPGAIPYRRNPAKDISQVTRHVAEICNLSRLKINKASE